MLTPLARIALRYRRASLALLLVTTALLAAGLPRLRTNVGYRAFLGEDHPAVRRLDAFVERFGGGLPMAAVWTCKDGAPCESALDAASLRMAHGVATRMRTVDGVHRVDSPATSPLMVQPLFGLPEARRLAPDGKPAADLEELSPIARDDPMWRGQLVSEDGRTGAVLVHLSHSGGAASERVFAALQQALRPFEADGFDFSLVGGPVEFVVAGGELDRNTSRIVPLMIVIIAIILLWVFRSWIATLAGLGSVGIAVVWTFGVMGWLGWERNSFTQALAPLLLVIGVCDAVHLLSRYIAQSPSVPRLDALLKACGEVAGPCLMTSVTTSAGFGSLIVSPLESLVRFGTLAVIGVMVSLLLTFTLLPILISYVPRNLLRRTAALARWDAGLDRLAAWSQRRRVVPLAAALVLSLAALAGLRSLELEASFEDLYGDGSQVVRWAHAVSEALRPPDSLEIALRPPAALKETPTAFAIARRLEAALENVHGLSRPRSIVDPMERLNTMLHHEPLTLAADSEERIESLLRLLRSQDSDVVGLFLHRPSGAMRISVEAQKLPQAELRRTLASVNDAVSASVPADWEATVTGPVPMVQEMIDEIRATQLESFALAAVLVFAMVGVFFRNLADVALSAVPTLLPVLLTLGTMGAAGIALDVGSAMVATVVVGIAVDDAIHLLTHYRRRRRDGMNVASACRAAVRHTGPALATTSIAMTLGFFTLILSPWKSVSSFGLVTGIAIGSALLATLIVLPALLSKRA